MQVADANAFALDLFRKLRSSPGNLAVSPSSIAVALAMACAGAAGETAAEMAKVLHLSDGLAGAGQLVPSQCGALTLKSASQLFGRQTSRFNDAYLADLREAFGAPLERVDFGQSEKARADINAWIANATEQRIRHLLPAGAVDAGTLLVIANAVYFLGNWVYEFQKYATTRMPFHHSKERTGDVDMMHIRERFDFAHTGGVSFLQLPYEGDAAMLFVLPDEIEGLDAVEKNLSPGQLASWLDALYRVDVQVSLPRVTIDPPDAFELSGHLAALGMPLAFDEDKADFSRMGDDPFVVSRVFHKAFVKIDEKGTEAAAATAVGMYAGSAFPQEPPKTESFIADHPFLFFLRDTRTGLILFMGRVTDP